MKLTARQTRELTKAAEHCINIMTADVTVSMSENSIKFVYPASAAQHLNIADSNGLVRLKDAAERILKCELGVLWFGFKDGNIVFWANTY